MWCQNEQDQIAQEYVNKKKIKNKKCKVALISQYANEKKETLLTMLQTISLSQWILLGLKYPQYAKKKCIKNHQNY